MWNSRAEEGKNCLGNTKLMLFFMAETWSLVFVGISIVGSTYIEPLQRRGLLSASYLIDPRFMG